MTTLITGATGFLGSALARALVARGDEVRALVRPASNRSALEGVRVEFVPGDVTDRADVDAAVKGCDRVFHAAALVATWRRDRSEFDRVNVDGTRNVVEASLSGGVGRIVYTSTFFALKPGERPMMEDSRAGEDEVRTDYARTKRLAQLMIDEIVKAGAPIVSVYPGVIFGPGPATSGNLIGQWILRFLRGSFPGYLGRGDRVWSFAYVDDVVRGHLLADEKGRLGRGYNLGGENTTIRSVMEAVASLTGRKPPTRCVPFGVAKCVGWLQECRASLTGREPELTRAVVDTLRHHWPLDPARASAELGWRPTPLGEALEKTVASLR